MIFNYVHFGGFMFGIYNVTKTEEKNEYEKSYGGLGSRLDYEQLTGGKNQKREGKVLRTLVTAMICLFFAATGLVVGVLVYDMVESNKSLYYPLGSMPHSADSMLDTQTAQMPSAIDALRNSTSRLGAENITADMSKKYRIPVGIWIRKIEKGSKVQQVGIREGDVIVAVDGYEVRDVEALNAMLSGRLGEIVLTIFRDYKYFDITLFAE